MPTLEQKVDEMLSLLKSGKVIIIQPGTGVKRQKVNRSEQATVAFGKTIKGQRNRKS